jgi:hypothetical protein
MWEAHTQVIQSGIRYRISRAGSQLSFGELFALLETNSGFVGWYADSLSATALSAFFWEHPPLTTETIDDRAEFVLIESASLARLDPDPRPFEAQFASQPDSDVVTFHNLGGDALLVVPRPIGPREVYPHLAAFLRGAPRHQVSALLKATAVAVRDHLSANATWLSTAGLGVSWLHLRLDSRPKYYKHEPYRTAQPTVALPGP